MSVLSSVGMFSTTRLKPIIFCYFHFSVLMGKRKEESISKPGPHKRQRQEYADEHSDESNEEENSQSSADSNSVSCLKSFVEGKIQEKS